MLLIYLPGAAGFGRSDTEAEMLPTNIKDSDILVCRVEGDLTFSAASALKNIISLQFKQAVENTGISSMVFDFRCASTPTPRVEKDLHGELEIVDVTRA
jgi:MFS superfamily sulfate permease-like transporter